MFVLAAIHQTSHAALSSGEYHQITYMNELKGDLLFSITIVLALVTLGGLYSIFKGLFKDSEEKSIVINLEKTLKIGIIGQGTLISMIGVFSLIAILDKVPDITQETTMKGEGIFLPNEYHLVSD